MTRVSAPDSAVCPPHYSFTCSPRAPPPAGRRVGGKRASACASWRIAAWKRIEELGGRFGKREERGSLVRCSIRCVQAHQRRCRASPRDPNGRGLTPLAAAPRRARANRPLRASQRPTHWALVLRLLPQLWVYGQDPEQGQQPFWTTAIVLCHHSAAQKPYKYMINNRMRAW